MTVLDYFRELGESVEQKWRVCDYDETVLPDIALEAMTARPAVHEVSADEVLTAVLEVPRLPDQLDFPGKFGEPPLTLYRTTRLIVDLYYWLDGTTTVHQHGFSGAFQLLSGSSIHAQYRFRAGQRLNARLVIGDLSLVRTELLGPGDTRPIASGPSFIHSLFHLDRPSSTIVIRTPHDQDAPPQYNYYRPHVGLDSHEDRLLSRRFEAMQILREMDEAAYEAEMDQVVNDSPYAEVVPYLIEYVKFESDMGRVSARAEHVRQRFGDKAARLEPVLREMRRQAAIIKRRRHAHHKDHRFLLATLLNCSSRAEVVNLVQRRYPHQDPVDWVVGCVADMVRARSGAEGEGELTNAIGLRFGEGTLPVFSGLLHGHTVGQIVATLVKDGFQAAGLEGQIAAFDKELRRSQIFSGLFPSSGVV
jgi:hypothetical protein